MAQFCPNCGNSVRDVEKFCSSCGYSLSPTDETSTHSIDVATSYTYNKSPTDAIILKSSAPITTKTGWSTWGYIITIVIGVLTAGAGLLLTLLVFAIEHFTMTFHRDKIRRLKFKFVDESTADDIYNKLQPALTKKFGDKIEFDRDDEKISVHYNSLIYDINVNDDGTFCIWWRKSIAGAIFSWNEWKLYKKVRTGTALIAYELQQLFGVK